ncbi:N-acetylmuramoyl-L-alanine amidase [Corynebacterium glutamicum]|uniref:N-acetylmuramoyl-L-alanine amidase n=1 Tax=Corynebacterium glutamicum TaxID=1718 RepID=UPI001B8AD544|nr:peptidoglycan recognition family protein [Corynebacterium glutamicum]
MKDWATLEPDKIRLMNKHFTPGRGGRKIRHVTIHHMAGIGDTDQCWNWWQTRQASAHYAISRTGEIGQLVWDRDTAWGNANLVANQESVIIEHSNSGGANLDWPIADPTLEEGAHLVAAICLFYGLGRPQWGVNVFTHSDFYATSCGYHLAKNRKYNAWYMGRAQWWYDQMSTQPIIGDEFMSALSDDQQREMYTSIKELRNAFLTPVPSRVEGSSFEAPRVDFIDLIDRKVEELHIEYSGKSTPAQLHMDANVAIIEAHTDGEEDDHAV